VGPAAADLLVGETIVDKDGTVWVREGAIRLSGYIPVRKLGSTQVVILASSERHRKTRLSDAEPGDVVEVGCDRYTVVKHEGSETELKREGGILSFAPVIKRVPREHGCIIRERPAAGKSQPVPAPQPEHYGRKGCCGNEPAGTEVWDDRGDKYVVVDLGGGTKRLLTSSGGLQRFLYPHTYHTRVKTAQPAVKVGDLVTDGNELFIVTGRTVVEQRPLTLRRVTAFAAPDVKAAPTKLYLPATVSHASAGR
jgi:hypothetical protein